MEYLKLILTLALLGGVVIIGTKVTSKVTAGVL